LCLLRFNLYVMQLNGTLVHKLCSVNDSKHSVWTRPNLLICWVILFPKHYVLSVSMCVGRHTTHADRTALFLRRYDFVPHHTTSVCIQFQTRR